MANEPLLDRGGQHPKAADAARHAAEISSLEKIRDILVGPQSREVDRRISELDGSIHQELRELRDKLGREIVTLQDLVRDRLKEISEDLGKEGSERRSGDDALRRQIDEVSEHWEERIGITETELGNMVDELRDSLESSSSRRFADLEEQLVSLEAHLGTFGERLGALGERLGTLDENLARTAERLRRQTVERSTLARGMRQLADELELADDEVDPTADSGAEG